MLLVLQWFVGPNSWKLHPFLHQTTSSGAIEISTKLICSPSLVQNVTKSTPSSGYRAGSFLRKNLIGPSNHALLFQPATYPPGSSNSSTTRVPVNPSQDLISACSLTTRVYPKFQFTRHA